MCTQKENSRLKRQLKLAWGQVGDMKLFLNDYGMVWVGTPNQEADYRARLAEEQRALVRGVRHQPADLPGPTVLKTEEPQVESRLYCSKAEFYRMTPR